MKYSNHVIINKPLARTVELFDNEDNMYKWMPGLKSHEHISGEKGKEGAKTKMVFEMGKRKIEMTETITKINFPHEFHGIYETKGVRNPQQNYFTAVDENTTKYESISEFQFDGFGMKLMGWLMPGAFKKQSQKYLDSFKAFAESQD